MQDLPIIQKTYDFIKWYIPILNRLPRNHRFTLGERIVNNLYDLLENLIRVRFNRKERLQRLQEINTQLDILRYQTRLLYDFTLIASRRYEYANKQIDRIGSDVGGWMKSVTS